MPSIRKLYEKLKQGGYSEVKRYYLMGKLTHYIADIFTFPHNAAFRGNIKAHGLYERKLHGYMKENLQSFERVDEEINIKDPDDLEELHKEYIQQAGTCEKDYRYIIQAVGFIEAVKDLGSEGNFKRREILNYEKMFSIICRIRDNEKRTEDSIRKRIHTV